MSRELRIERAESVIEVVRALAGGTPACAETDPEVFFPVSEQHAHRVAVAKRICRDCPVRTACLRQAMARGEHGIWGGTTEGERRRLRRKQKAKNQNQNQDQNQDQQASEITEGVQAA